MEEEKDEWSVDGLRGARTRSENYGRVGGRGLEAQKEDWKTTGESEEGLNCQGQVLFRWSWEHGNMGTWEQGNRDLTGTQQVRE
jgi:hypothetical protein